MTDPRVDDFMLGCLGLTTVSALHSWPDPFFAFLVVAGVCALMVRMSFVPRR